MAAACSRGTFSRCAQTTAGSPAPMVSAMRAAEAAGSVPDDRTCSACSARTCAPVSSAYGATLSRQRAAAELITRARGAKAASSGASSFASARPLLSSGRSPSSSFHFERGTAVACRSRMSGTVSAGPLAKSSSTRTSCA